ncbi:MAG TPA: hypothetical protein VF807_00325 [Ktedonobacterales bacterium]
MSRSPSWSARALRLVLVWGTLLVALMVTAAPAQAASPVSIVTITQNARSLQSATVNIAVRTSGASHAIVVTPSQLISQSGIAMATMVRVGTQSEKVTVAMVRQRAFANQRLTLNVDVWGNANTLSVLVRPTQIVTQSGVAVASGQDQLRANVSQRAILSQWMRVNLRFHGSDNTAMTTISPAQGLHQTTVVTTTDAQGNPVRGSRQVARHFWIERHYFVWHWGGHDNRVTISYQPIAA